MSVALVAGGIAVATVATAQEEPTVLIANDFEDGAVTPWGPRGGVSLEVVGDGRGGGQALSVGNRTADWQGVATDVTALFEEGVSYSATAWVRLPAGTPAAGIHFTVQGVPSDGSGDTFTWVGDSVSTTDAEWVQIGGEYTRPAGLASLTLYIEAEGTTPFLVDDILVTGPATPPDGPDPAILHTSDFEGSLNGWAPREAGESGHTVTLSSDLAHGGTQSALISGRDSQGDGMALDVTALTEPGVTYRVTAWLRFAPDAPTDEVWLSSATTTGGSTTFATLSRFTTVTNTDWVQVSGSFTVPAADNRLIYFETRWQDGEAGNTSDLYVDDIVLEIPPPPVVENITPVKSTVDFPLGVAIDSRETAGNSAQLTLRHFNQITAENHMKPEAWYAADRTFQPSADAIAVMDFAVANNLRVYGHVLLWHSQVPDWFFQDDAGTPLTTSPEHQQLLRDRLHEHINNVAEWLATNYGEFGGGNPIVAFDVVNEVIADSGEFADGLRRSEWYRILGEEYIHLAFQWAQEAFNETYAADGATNPVTLFINDYNTEQGAKQDRYLALVQRLLAAGVPVHGVGHQFHVSLTTPISSLAGALDRFADVDVVQAVTELDVTVGTPVSEARLVEQGYYYRDLFDVLRSYSAADPGDLYSVTLWGLTDNRSWRSTQAPLIFDAALQAKPAYHGAVNGELPPLLRTANVFGGDVALDASGLASVAWQQLPPQAAGEAATFGLRWSADHLTVLATVADDAADAIAFTYGGAELTFAKAGGGVSGVVDDAGPGWRAVIHLPHTGVELGDTGEFDLRVLDGDTVLGAWNTPGSLGTLSFIEDLSYVEVVQATAAPAIDGTVDPIWDSANVVRTAKRVEGSTDAQADVRTLWSDDTLYVLFQVTDPVIDLTSGNPWEQDSVEIFIDAGNAKNGGYRAEDAQLRINVDNVRSFGTGDAAAQSERLTSATARVDGGYVVEAAITLLGRGGLGTFQGVDFQVNDGSPREGQATGTRTAAHTWAEPTGTGFQTTARWGVAQLVGAPGPQVPTCTRTVSGLRLGSVKVTSGVTCLTGSAIILGKVTVSPGASLISDGAVVIGTISANGAAWIDIRGGGTGPLTITGTTQHLSIVDTVVAGAGKINNNTTPDPIVVSDNLVVGLLACSGNEPPPVNNGEKNTIIGLASGQCRGL